MSNFELITSSHDLITQATWYWGKFGPEDAEGNRINDTTPVPKMPLLVAFYISSLKGGGRISYRVSRILCTKKDAKRIIYPKTNGLKRGYSYAFSWFEDRIAEKVDRFMQIRLKHSKIDPLGPVQSRYTKEIMVKAKNTAGPVLISYYNHTLPKRAIEFFLVDKRDASKLVYYDKNYPQEQLQKQPEEQPVPPPDGFEALEPYSIIVVGGTNMVKVQLAASFDDQNHVPRFKLDAGDRIEDDIRKWEQASIIEMNNKIRNFAMPVNPAIAMAHGITKEFLDMRRKMRLNKMLDYQPHCINTYTVLSNPLMKQILQEIQKKRKAIAYLARQ